MAKQDFLGVCNEHNVPLDDFQRQFCIRCLQPECTRSQVGKSKFEERVATWEDRLFLNPSRLDPSDPRYQGIAAKRFLAIAPSDPNRQSSWDDPRDIEKRVMVSVPETLTSNPLPLIDLPETPAVPSPEERKAALNELVRLTEEFGGYEKELAKPEVQPTPAPPTPEKAPVPQQRPLGNTPNRSRQMLSNVEQTTPSPVLDPWQPKQGLKPGETLVQPGAKIKLGGQ